MLGLWAVSRSQALLSYRFPRLRFKIFAIRVCFGVFFPLVGKAMSSFAHTSKYKSQKILLLFRFRSFTWCYFLFKSFMSRISNDIFEAEGLAYFISSLLIVMNDFFHDSDFYGFACLNEVIFSRSCLFISGRA